jgi:hypothetical protein
LAIVVDDGADVALGLLGLILFSVDMSSRPISLSRLLLKSLETSYIRIKRHHYLNQSFSRVA